MSYDCERWTPWCPSRPVRCCLWNTYLCLGGKTIRWNRFGDMSINEQSLGRSPPKMRATERGVKWAVCVCILCVYIRHEVYSSNPASFSSNSRHLPVRAPSHVCARAMEGAPAQSFPILFCRNKDWWVARGGGHRSAVMLHA